MSYSFAQIVDHHSKRKESTEELSKRVNQQECVSRRIQIDGTDAMGSEA